MISRNFIFASILLIFSSKVLAGGFGLRVDLPFLTTSNFKAQDGSELAWAKSYSLGASFSPTHYSWNDRLLSPLVLGLSFEEMHAESQGDGFRRTNDLSMTFFHLSSGVVYVIHEDWLLTGLVGGSYGTGNLSQSSNSATVSTGRDLSGLQAMGANTSLVFDYIGWTGGTLGVGFGMSSTDYGIDGARISNRPSLEVRSGGVFALDSLSLAQTPLDPLPANLNVQRLYLILQGSIHF